MDVLVWLMLLLLVLVLVLVLRLLDETEILRPPKRSMQTKNRRPNIKGHSRMKTPLLSSPCLLPQLLPLLLGASGTDRFYGRRSCGG